MTQRRSLPNDQQHDSESSGLTDILEIASSLATDETAGQIQTQNPQRPQGATAVVVPPSDDLKAMGATHAVTADSTPPWRRKIWMTAAAGLAVGALLFAAIVQFGLPPGPETGIKAAGLVVLEFPRRATADPVIPAQAKAPPDRDPVLDNPPVREQSEADNIASTRLEAVEATTPSIPNHEPAPERAQKRQPEQKQQPTAPDVVTKRNPVAAPDPFEDAAQKPGPTAAPDQPTPVEAGDAPASPQTNTDAKFSSDCLLNPDKPGCREPSGEIKKAPTPKTPSLPDKLSGSDLRESLAPVKAEAKACGVTHNALSGTRVRIKLSIDGASGRVVSAEAINEHARAAVGKCVARALMQAQFPRFKTPRQGIVYPVFL